MGFRPNRLVPVMFSKIGSEMDALMLSGRVASFNCANKNR